MTERGGVTWGHSLSSELSSGLWNGCSRARCCRSRGETMPRRTNAPARLAKAAWTQGSTRRCWIYKIRAPAAMKRRGSRGKNGWLGAEGDLLEAVGIQWNSWSCKLFCSFCCGMTFRVPTGARKASCLKGFNGILRVLRTFHRSFSLCRTVFILQRKILSMY